MSTDVRTVHTDALETLGMIHFKPEARDAIHLAVEPIRAAHQLAPGQHVSIVGGEACAAFTAGVPPVGIVDPFLPEPVLNGEHFWLVVYPRMITSLRHVWEHPSFPKED